MNNWNTLADQISLDITIASLKKANITSVVVSNGAEAQKKVTELLPSGAEVMTMTSVTLETTGISKEINQSGKYNAVMPKLYSMNRETDSVAMQKLGAAPEWVIGSIHAVSEDGHVVIASNSGSQLPAYAYGSGHVIWVVGTQKIVKDLDSAMKRVYEHVLPLESERAHKAYGVPASNVSKLLVINNEVTPGRITIIFVKELLGF
jgi:L-lactate utilization protein LutC